MPVELAYAIVAFLDILGYRRMVAEDSQSRQPAHLPRILHAIGVVDDAAGSGGVAMRLISDSLVLSVPFSPAGLVAVAATSAALQRALFSEQIWLRGGIAHGKHYADDRAIFSEALVRAYELETSVARVPRVVVDDGLLDLTGTHPDLTQVQREELDALVARDRDRRAFLRYLDADHIQSHADSVRAMYESQDLTEPGLLEKALWLIDYHNYSCEMLSAGAMKIQGITTGFAPR